MLLQELVVGQEYMMRVPGADSVRVRLLKTCRTRVRVSIVTGAGRFKQGTTWRVDPDMLSAPGAVHVPPVDVPTALRFEKYGDPVHNQILRLIMEVYAALMPENLTCDGTLKLAQVQKKSERLQRQLRGLQAAAGAAITEEQAYEWDRQRMASNGCLS